MFLYFIKIKQPCCFFLQFKDLQIAILCAGILQVISHLIILHLVAIYFGIASFERLDCCPSAEKQFVPVDRLFVSYVNNPPESTIQGSISKVGWL